MDPLFVIGLAIAEVIDFDARNLWEEGDGVGRLYLVVIGSCSRSTLDFSRGISGRAPTLVWQPKDR